MGLLFYNMNKKEQIIEEKEQDVDEEPEMVDVYSNISTCRALFLRGK